MALRFAALLPALALTSLSMAVASSAGAQTTSVAPVQKVIQLLTDMSAKSKKEKEAEEVAFAAFSTWCTEHSASLKKDIAKKNQEMERLSAEIGELGTQATQLGESIAGLQGDVAKYEAEKESQTKQRAAANAEFLAESKDYSESISALGRAISVLEKQSYDRTGEEILLQVASMDRLPEKAKSIVTAFMDMQAGDGSAGPDYKVPEANAYEFQSSSIVDLLKRLSGEFQEKLAESQKEEMSSRHAFDMIMEDLTDAIANAKKNTEEKTAEKERKQEAAALNKKQLAATTEDEASSSETLSDLEAECSQKKMSYEEKQTLRVEELEALDKAIEILSSPDLLGNAEKHLALSQASRSTSLLQRRSEVKQTAGAAGIRRRIREALESSATKLSSKRLGLLAERVAAEPFAKVKKLIDDMITRLLEEANADADHEGFCDMEMGKSKITRDKLSVEISELSAAAEEGKATIMRLGESIKLSSQEVDELTRMMNEASQVRSAEKAKNKETVKDSQEAQAALQAATAVLKDFYTKAAGATALLQEGSRLVLPSMGSEEWQALANTSFEGTVDKGHKAGMQTYGETYVGKQSEETGVLAMLEVIESDFATLEADTKADEAASESSYEAFMTESKKTLATKKRSIEMETADKAASESQLQSDIADLKATQDQLIAAEHYHEKIDAQCVDKGMTFEERTKAREAEIASLKEALAMLNSEDIQTSAL
mmetsp:Transcript_8231/g.17973  ORF Transcript_8231/g.17973 Transcript_8231/m.17973 type:complete len:717 (-) Transcript_8231:57-2207(-)